MVDSLYGYAQQFVAGLFNHKPIIDMIQEKDKYGNDGDKYRNIGIAVVNSFEGLSNFLNSAVEVRSHKYLDRNSEKNDIRRFQTIIHNHENIQNRSKRLVCKCTLHSFLFTRARA